MNKKSSQSIVVVKNLKKSYDGQTVVNDISFSVKKGEVFGILGPNGAGKTTTLEMLEALRPIDSGNATINGIDVATSPYDVRSIIGVQPQNPSFQDKTKLSELIELFAAAYGEKVDAATFLKDVDLEDKTSSYDENLSGGQHQRFSIAPALVHNQPPDSILKHVEIYGNSCEKFATMGSRSSSPHTTWMKLKCYATESP